DPIRTGDFLTVTGWIDLLKTYMVLDRVVQDLRLYLTERAPGNSAALESFRLKRRLRPWTYRLRIDRAGRTFTLESSDGTVIQRGEVGDSIGQAVGFAWAPPAALLAPGEEIEFTVEVPRDVARSLAEKIKPQIDPSGNILRLELSGPEPERITTGLNDENDRYDQVAGERERAKRKEPTKILHSQLGAAERSLREAEAELEAFQVRTAGMPRLLEAQVGPPVGPEGVGGDPIYTDYFQLKLEQERLRRDRMSLERILSQIA